LVFPCAPCGSGRRHFARAGKRRSRVLPPTRLAPASISTRSAATAAARPGSTQTSCAVQRSSSNTPPRHGSRTRSSNSPLTIPSPDSGRSSPDAPPAATIPARSPSSTASVSRSRILQPSPISAIWRSKPGSTATSTWSPTPTIPATSSACSCAPRPEYAPARRAPPGQRPDDNYRASGRRRHPPAPDPARLQAPFPSPLISVQIP